LFVSESVGLLVLTNVTKLLKEFIDSFQIHEFGFDCIIRNFDMSVLGLEWVLNDTKR